MVPIGLPFTIPALDKIAPRVFARLGLMHHALVGIGAKGEGLQIYNFDAKYDEWISKGIEFRWGDQLKVTGN